MLFVSEIEAVTTTDLLEWCRTIDENHRVGNVVFLTYFGKERVRENVRSRRFELRVE